MSDNIQTNLAESEESSSVCSSLEDNQESGEQFEIDRDAMAAIKSCLKELHKDVYIGRKKDRVKSRWHIVLIDRNKREDYLEQHKTGSVDCAKYGVILLSGWGLDPPPNIVSKVSEFFEEKVPNDLYVTKDNCENMSIYNYVLIDSNKEDMILEKYGTGLESFREIRNCGYVLYSGWGQDPAESISHRIVSAYFCSIDQELKEEFSNSSVQDSLALQDDVKNGKQETSRGIIKPVFDVNGANGWTSWHHVAYLGHCSWADLQVKDVVCGRLPAHIAAREGHTDLVELFLTKGVKVDDVDRNKWTLLHYAAWSGNLTTVSFLIDKGADINARETIYGKKPIHTAAERGYMDVVQLFLESGASVEDTDRDGRTSLFYAAWRGQLGVVKYLANVNANIHAQKTDSTRPIHIAAREGHQNVIEFLIHQGVNVNHSDKDQMTPLHYAAEYGHIKVARFLINKGANVESKNRLTQTPLYFARNKGHEEIVHILERKEGK